MNMNSSGDWIADAYIPDPELTIAAEVALELGLPLLLTGEPGTGKSTFASYLAGRLAPDWYRQRGSQNKAFTLHAFETKSTSVAADLFYRFDNLRRFHAAHDSSMSKENRDYLTFEALGKAILFSHRWEEVSDLIPSKDEHPGAVRSVVLIDEVDKAPRDFPNDILNEIQRMFFRIPEVRYPNGQGMRTVYADPNLRPIVVITSNSEKNLPGAFLRRCVFHHIRFPERKFKERMRDIVSANLGQAVGALASSAMDFFYDVREQLSLEKAPSTAELVQWISLLQSRRWGGLNGHPGNLGLEKLPIQELAATLGVLAKTADDLAKLQALAQQRFARPTA